MKAKSLSKEYGVLLQSIKSRVRQAQYEALKAVNKELIALYRDIGKMIAGRQKGETWGKSIVQQLAADLQEEFPGMKGFSAQNLWYMRQFYLAYSNDEKLQPMVGEIGWSHNLIIMGKCKDPLEQKRLDPSDRKPDLRKDGHQPDQLRQNPPWADSEAG